MFQPHLSKVPVLLLPSQYQVSSLVSFSMKSLRSMFQQRVLSRNSMFQPHPSKVPVLLLPSQYQVSSVVPFSMKSLHSMFQQRVLRRNWMFQPHLSRSLHLRWIHRLDRSNPPTFCPRKRPKAPIDLML